MKNSTCGYKPLFYTKAVYEGQIGLLFISKSTYDSSFYRVFLIKEYLKNFVPKEQWTNQGFRHMIEEVSPIEFTHGQSLTNNFIRSVIRLETNKLSL